MSEAHVLADIRLNLGRDPAVRLFRNQVGALKDQTGRLVRYGLCTGSADLIGLRTITVTEDMVGHKLAVFSAIEVKSPSSYRGTTSEQDNFLKMVIAMGGFGGVAKSAEDAREILGL